MIQEGNIKNRHVLARWNSIIIAQSLGELNSVKVCNNEITNTDDFELYRYEWLKDKNIFSAIDFISSAFLHGYTSITKEACEYLNRKLEEQADMPILVKHLISNEKNQPILAQNNDLNSKIRVVRKYLIQHPRDSIVWVELARCYLIKGQLASAEKALTIAFGLSPNNRFVIRAISSFYTYTGELDKALRFATNSDVVKYDPRTLSNQIAISNIYGKTSRLIKNGSLLLENTSVNPRSISELASELGTMDFESGNKKKGKKKFLLACNKPHENALAQIFWVDKNIARVGQYEIESASAPCDYEAKVHLNLMGNPDWRKLLSNAKDWASYQSYYTMPILLGSCIAVNILDDYDSAIALLETGNSIITNNPGIKNNYVYTLTLMGKEEKVREILESINMTDINGPDKVSITATRGLVEYRFGNSEKGKTLYLEAAEMAKQSKNMQGYYTAFVYLAREEKLKGHNVDSLLDEIRKGHEYTKECMLNAVIKKFELF